MISPHDLQILSATSLFAGFSEEALRALCAALRPSVAELPRGRVLWRMGEQVTQAGIVLSGRVEAWHYTAAGQADLAAVHGAGGVFGDVLMSAQTVGSPVELRTAADSRVFFLSLASLLALCAAGTVRGCWKICSAKFRKNIGDCSGASSVCPFRMGGGGWRFISARRAQRISCSPFPGNRWPGSSA